MRRVSSQMCPRFQLAVDLLARRWTAQVVQALRNGPRRFGELRDYLEVVSERMLSERLKDLEGCGVLSRRVIPETPVHVEYELSEKGRALGSVMDAVAAWGERWCQTQEECSSEEPAGGRSDS